MQIDTAEWTRELRRAFLEGMDAVRERHPNGWDYRQLTEAAVQTYLERHGVPDQMTIAALETEARQHVHAQLLLGGLPTQNMFLVIAIAYTACACAARLIDRDTAQDALAQARTMAAQLESGTVPSAAPPIRVPGSRRGFIDDLRIAWAKSRTMHGIETHDGQVFRVEPDDELGLALIHAHGQRGAGCTLADFHCLARQLRADLKAALARIPPAAPQERFCRFAVAYISIHVAAKWLSSLRARRLAADVVAGRLGPATGSQG